MIDFDDDAPPPMSEDDSPVYYTIPEITKAFGRGWTSRRVRQWLKRMDLVDKRGGTLVTTSERVAAEFPEVYRRLLDSNLVSRRR